MKFLCHNLINYYQHDSLILLFVVYEKLCVAWIFKPLGFFISSGGSFGACCSLQIKASIWQNGGGNGYSPFSLNAFCHKQHTSTVLTLHSDKPAKQCCTDMMKWTAFTMIPLRGNGKMTASSRQLFFPAVRPHVQSVSLALRFDFFFFYSINCFLGKVADLTITRLCNSTFSRILLFSVFVQI